MLLGQPLYAFAAILGCVLVFSGLGSLASHTFSDAKLRRSTRWLLAAVVAGVAIHVIWMPALLHSAMAFPMPMRVLVTVVTIAPLGFLMGMPLPLGMRLMKLRAPNALAWAWGVNGSLTVVGTVLAMVISIFFGIGITLMLAAVLYAVALSST